MKTLLLLAGRSKRFWPLKEKTLFPIAGKTLLEHQVAALKAGGCKEIILVSGEHNMKAAHKMFPILKIIKQEDLEGGMQAALLSALPSLKKEAVLIVGGNDVIEPKAFRELRNAAERPEVQGAILAKKVKDYFPGGYLVTKASRVLAVQEKPGAGNEPSDLVNIVAHLHNDASILLKAVQKAKAKKDDGYEVALTALMKEYVYRVVPYNGLWQPVKYPWHLLNLLPMFLGGITKSSPARRLVPRSQEAKGGSPARAGEGGISKSASIHKTAVIEGPVWIGEHVKVLPHATIVGPCRIDAGTIVGTGALVRGSSVGKNCVIGFGSEVKGSILGDDVWAHMTYIGDSIVGNNVSFGARSTTGNFRLDEGEIQSDIKGEKIGTGLTKFGSVIGDHCRLGICSGINPGIKIGSGSFIGGGAYLTEDIPEGSFVTTKNGVLHIRPNKVEPMNAEQREKYRK